MTPTSEPTPYRTATTTDGRPIELPVRTGLPAGLPAGLPPELPAEALPEIDWIHLFACRYGGAIEGARRSRVNGTPIGTGVPSRSTRGGRWHAEAYLAGGGSLEGHPGPEGDAWGRVDARAGGAVFTGRVLVVPYDRLERAFRICQWWLAAPGRPGIVEWSPAFGTGAAGSFYGVRIRTRDTCWGRLAEVIGATWRITIDRKAGGRGRCVVAETSGKVLAWQHGTLHHAYCDGLAASLPLPTGRRRNYPAPPLELTNTRS